LITIVHKHRVTVNKHHQTILKTRLSKDQVIRKTITQISKEHNHYRNQKILKIEN